MIHKMRKSDFIHREFNEKTYPYAYKNVCELTDKEMWKSLVSIGKERGAFASLARDLAPSFNLVRKNIEDMKPLDVLSENIKQSVVWDWDDYKEYTCLKDIVRKMLTLAKHHEVW